MTIKMRTILSKIGHSALRTPAGAQTINTQLFNIQPLVKPLEMNGLTLVLKHIHIDQGMYIHGRTVQPHCHQEIQIEYVLSGRFLFRGAAEQCRLAPGQGNVIFPNIKHTWRCEAAGAMLGILLEAVGPKREKFLLARPMAKGRFMPVFSSPDIALWARQLFNLLAVHPGPWHRERAAGILEVLLRASLVEALMLDAWLPRAQAGGVQTDSHGRHICERAIECRIRQFQPTDVFAGYCRSRGCQRATFKPTVLSPCGTKHP